LINDGVIDRFLNSASLTGVGVVVLSSFLQATNNDVVAEMKRRDKLSFLFDISLFLSYEIIGSASFAFILNINKLLSNLVKS
jgi:hypothetical protein